MDVAQYFSLEGKVAVVTGGGGVLGGAIAKGLAQAGANVAITDINDERGERVSKEIEAHGPGKARAYHLDVFDRSTVESCCDSVCNDFGGVDILINTAGGNMKEATTSPDNSFFDLPADALDKVIKLNFQAGVVMPCQVFGRAMKDNEAGGSIISISSMSALLPLTRVPGYSAAKAAVDNFTKWLAVHFAQEYNPKLRVNAIAPGFFLTDQNRYLLTDEKTGELTDRGRTIIDHTPQGAFGEPGDLLGVTIWLASDSARFVTGIVVPIDGGFSSFSGV